MLSSEDNQFLTQVSPGTPMGDLFRRFWIPILLSEELPDPDCDPIRIKVVGDFFVAFRDTSGRLGLLDARCPHRGADLSFGFNEEGGLRCGRCFWKFDVDGNILDLPMEPADSPLWHQVKAPAFKIREYGGLIWGYVGPQDQDPEIPEFEWTHVPAENRHLSRFLVECNYMQGVEAGLDSARVSALEKSGLYDIKNFMSEEPEHQVIAKVTDYGLAVTTQLLADGTDTSDIQVTHWLMPFYTTAPVTTRNIQEGIAWVPIDDEATMAFAVTYNLVKPLSKTMRDQIRKGQRVHPQHADGTVRRKRNKDNGYVGEKKRRSGFTDFASRFSSTFEMTVACQESMGTIVDRSQENLSENDGAILGARSSLREAAVDLMEGTIPVIANKGEAYQVRSANGPASAHDVAKD